MQSIINMVMQHSALLAAPFANLPISPIIWIPVALIAVLAVIVVAAFTYILSTIVKSENAKAWARFQVYEALLSIILIIAFGALSFLFFLSPQPVFSALNLVPSTCTGASQLHTLASCDLSVFNNASFAFARYILYATYGIAFISGESPTFNPKPFGALSISFSVTAPPLVSVQTIQILTFTYEIILFALIFNQVQLILLAGSVFFLSFFLTIGVLARTTGFLRTFGGGMIAFGLGLGIVYPLLISLTYGYVDVAANLVCMQSTACAVLGATTSILAAIGALVLNLVTTLSLSALPAAIGALFMYIGYILVGLTVIPFINIAIVDAFIIDFSSAIGERMSFSQLFSNLI